MNVRDGIYDILSLGVGVQSSTVLLMSCLGELPKLDHAVFADPRWEGKGTYTYFRWLKSFAKDHGIPVHLVTCGRNIRDDGIGATKPSKGRPTDRYAAMPLYVQVAGQKTEGQIKRQCTKEYKIEPIERFIKIDVLKLKRRGHWPKQHAVRHWYGISADEYARVSLPVKTRTVKVVDLLGEREETETVPIRWKSNYYPLIGLELIGLRKRNHDRREQMTRLDCLEWLDSHGFERPPRSACIGCPFHDNAEWADMKRNRPEEFEDACEFDDAIRHSAGRRGMAYLHRSLTPLRDIDFDAEPEMPLFQIGGVAANECMGVCGS